MIILSARRTLYCIHNIMPCESQSRGALISTLLSNVVNLLYSFDFFVLNPKHLQPFTLCSSFLDQFITDVCLLTSREQPAILEKIGEVGV